jgi:hypothetical protein
MTTINNGYGTSVDWRELRLLALQESRAHRAYAKAGIVPNTRKMIWPWDPQHCGTYQTPKIQDLEHGTDACYRQHLRLGTEPCKPCRDAHNRAKREQRKRLDSQQSVA